MYTSLYPFSQVMSIPEDEKTPLQHWLKVWWLDNFGAKVISSNNCLDESSPVKFFEHSAVNIHHFSNFQHLR
jgi:hypothetical protein